MCYVLETVPPLRTAGFILYSFLLAEFWEMLRVRWWKGHHTITTEAWMLYKSKCYALKCLCPPPKFICWNSNVPSIGLRWGFLEAISHNSRALTNAFHKQLLYKRGPRELPCPFRHVRTRSQQSDLREGRRPSSDQAGTLIVVFQPPELWGINFVVYRLPSLWYYTAAQMD